jgi:invasion protein IalB
MRFRWTVPVLLLLVLTGVSVAHAQKPVSSAWVKLCEKANAVTKDKDGKDEKKLVNICLTHHERLDGNTGSTVVSAAVRQAAGQDKMHFVVVVPQGVLTQQGMRVSIYPKEQWERVQKNEKIDETKLKVIKLEYALCQSTGCTAEVEATPELIADLKSAGGLVAFAINAGGQPVGFPVSLLGFEQALSGPPIDSETYREARKALINAIQERRKVIDAAAARVPRNGPIVCAGAEWSGCSMKPIQEWKK